MVGAWIPCLFANGDLVATCVLRPLPDKWLLETLRAHKGYGTPLLRAVIPWLYAKGAPFTLGYTWELSAPGLCGAWLKGWLGSATSLQYGWAWSAEGECGFCPTDWMPLQPRFVLPTFFQDGAGIAIVSDSGLGDGWGNVLLYRGSPDWTAIANKGGWKKLWMRAATRPCEGQSKSWNWTGEFVVVGLLNYREEAPDLEWITAEI
jgi:hypothetical protein